jgi:hypothetical protein
MLTELPQQALRMASSSLYTWRDPVQQPLTCQSSPDLQKHSGLTRQPANTPVLQILPYPIPDQKCSFLRLVVKETGFWCLKCSKTGVVLFRNCIFPYIFIDPIRNRTYIMKRFSPGQSIFFSGFFIRIQYKFFYVIVVGCMVVITKQR